MATHKIKIIIISQVIEILTQIIIILFFYYNNFFTNNYQICFTLVISTVIADICSFAYLIFHYNIDYKTNFTNNVEMFSINQGITKLRIYMWLEGQDVDCENDASVGSISLNLQFSTNPN